MEIRVIPVQINKAGENLFYAVPGDKTPQLHIAAFTSPGLPDKTAIVDHVQDLLVENDPALFSVVEIPHTDETATYFVLAGNETAFSLINDEGRWVAPSGVKFGPPPARLTAANKNSLWTGALETGPLIALLSSAYALRAIRLGMTPSDEAAGALATVAASSTAVAQFMDVKIDRSLPALVPGQTVPAAADKWKQITRALTKLAAQTTQTLRQINQMADSAANTETPEPAAPVSPRTRKKRTKEQPEEVRIQGRVPKPA